MICPASEQPLTDVEFLSPTELRCPYCKRAILRERWTVGIPIHNLPASMVVSRETLEGKEK
jgi:hypothetical protein